MTPRPPMKVLLLQLEFPTWKQARAWTYPACFGVAEGLRASGVDCTTLPLIADPPYSSTAWLAHMKRMLKGQRFDQVWVWLVHAPLDEAILNWLSELAPIRVGIIMESLQYSEEDYAWAPHLRARQGFVEQQVRALTHVLVPDECDVERTAARTGVPALWFPPMVPERFISTPQNAPVHRVGVFHGVPYGPREQWIHHPALKSCLTFARPSAPTLFQQLFDRLQQSAIQRLATPAGMPAAELTHYTTMLQEVREGEFREWMTQLPQWAAIVNLPSLAKFFGGRVFEGIAAGRPVVSYAVPGHPMNNSLFVEGEEILYFSPSRPDSLAEVLDRLLADDTFATRIAGNAQHKLRTYHTSERRLVETLAWIQSGTTPVYGEREAGAAYMLSSAKTGHAAPSVEPRPTQAIGHVDTTIFILTVDDPAYPACKAAVDAQQGGPFHVEIIRNVAPFSAAAQRMIADCRTEFFIQVDEDMILNLDAATKMTDLMRRAPSEVGMICFHLYDEDRACRIQGIKIYRTAAMKPFAFQNVKASEMDLLEQMGQRGVRWVLHPDVLGRHGTVYTPETIYRRYKTMYEKDIRQWNTLTSDIRRKADQFRATGDLLALFALLGAAHGIIESPRSADREKDARAYGLNELDIFARLFRQTPPASQPYDAKRSGTPVANSPLAPEEVRWGGEAAIGNAPDQQAFQRATPAAQPPRHHAARILIVTPYFWPSVGGVEKVAESLAVGLQSRGHAVEVATYALTERSAQSHRGIPIIDLTFPADFETTSPYSMLEVKRLIESGHYGCCILLGAPLHLMFYAALAIPKDRPVRFILQPTINKEIAESLQGSEQGRTMLSQLGQRVNAVVTFGGNGYDEQFFQERRIPTCVIPNGTPALAPKNDFRQRYGIARDTFLVIHLANLYKVKNHPGLLDALDHLPNGVQLVLIGNDTHETEYVETVKARLKTRPDVRLLAGLEPADVASALAAADLVVLASHAEVSPLCLLEAMSVGRPWLATPDCGTAAEHAGGLVLPLSQFASTVGLLKKHPELCAELGRLGREHWAQSHDWATVLTAWEDLIEGRPVSHSFGTPVSIAERRETLREAFRRLLAQEGTAVASTASTLQVETKGVVMDGLNQGPRGSVDRLAISNSAPTPQEQKQQDEFYIDMFVKSRGWSSPGPNHDEAARWSKIAAFLEYLLRRVRQTDPQRQLRMLDVGCGRGWLTNLATAYGTCEGIEPVAGVIEHARRLFPHLRFEAGTAQSVLSRPDFAPYDVILCSEVIEHIPHGRKEGFVAELSMLLKPDGYVILTTPRGEMWEQWKTIAPPCQPVEDWVTEAQLRDIFVSQGFCELGLERVHCELPSLRYIPAPTPADFHKLNLVPIYQIWACQRRGASPVPSFTRPPMVSVIVPTYNRPDRLQVALSSILAQTYQDFEIIVVNDGTVDVSDVIAPLNRDGRITVIRHDRNRGLAAARNTGIRAAKGTYIAYLDDDDTYLPDHLQTLVTTLQGGEHKVAYTDAWRIHEVRQGDQYVVTGQDIPYSRDFNCIDLLLCNYFPVLCVMHEKACLEQVGVFDESLFAHEDWDLWIRMATIYPFLHIKHTTAAFTWRRDGSSMTSSTSDTYRRTTEIIYRKYRPYAERIAGVLEAQQKKLEGMRSDAQAKTFDCSIIIPVWNNLALTTQCLTALAEVTQGVSYEVIVVDNHSTDDTPAFLAGLGGDVKIITNNDNLGFAKACNQGAQAAKGEYLVFLNNDTIPQAGWLSALVEEVKAHSEVAVVGSKLLYEDGTIQHAGVAFSREFLMPYHMYPGVPADAPFVSRRRELQCVTAACMLIRRQVFAQVGGFDEGYKNGFEDVDLCLKVGEKNWKIVYQPQSTVIHLESRTPGRKAHEEENTLRFRERWGRCWWVTDEDRLHFDDGYSVHTHLKDGLLGYTLYLITDPAIRAERAFVADVQRATAVKDQQKIVSLLKRIEQWPTDAWILRWGALLSEGIGHLELALSFWKRVISLKNDPQARLALAKQALESGAMKEADHHVTALLQAEPSHGEGWLLRGILAMQLNAYRDAEQAFEQAKQAGAHPRKAMLGLVMAAMGDNRPEAAWSHVAGLCADYPDDEECMHWMLKCGTLLQRWDALATRLSSFVARNPGNIAMRFALAGVLLRAGRRADAQREYDWLRAMVPTFEGMDELAKQLAESERPLVPNHAA
ncbi:MAG TPA: glycosyltransferase [Nitrospira sp.]|nr:glycosyltransferase [Nitrospira sp.]